MTEYKRNPGSSANARALEMSEAGRARSLLDTLADRATAGVKSIDSVSQNLLQLRIAVDQLFDQRLKLLMQVDRKHELEANAAELTQAVESLERTEDGARPSASALHAAAQIRTAPAIESASRDSGATFLEYSLGLEHSFLWVVDHGTLKTYVLPPGDRIERMVRKWRELTLAAVPGAGSLNLPGSTSEGAASELQRLSVELSCALLSTAVDPNMKQLIIVPDGDLAMLPFAALPENGCTSRTSDQPSALLVRHEIILTPSLSVYLSQKTPTDEDGLKGEVAILADPVFDPDDPRVPTHARVHMSSFSSRMRSETVAPALPRLLNTRFEAASIEEAVGPHEALVRLGFDASLQTVLSPAMREYRIWHFATHGVYDQSTPEFSGLVFSLYAPDGSPVSAFLKADDIAHLDVRSELVVLNACDSTAGFNLSGEGVMGLSYSFLRAGARGVISTLWSIDDTVSKELMTEFYSEMMHNGNNAADALRHSQLAVMRRHPSSAPYYWAGFALTSVGN